MTKIILQKRNDNKAVSILASEREEKTFFGTYNASADFPTRFKHLERLGKVNRGITSSLLFN